MRNPRIRLAAVCGLLMAFVGFSPMPGFADSAPTAAPVTFSANPIDATATFKVFTTLSGAGTWSFKLTDICTGATLRTTSGEVTQASKLNVVIDPLSTPTITRGPAVATFTPSSPSGVAGKSVSAVLNVYPPSTSTTYKSSICSNVTRLISTDSAYSQLVLAGIISREVDAEQQTVMVTARTSNDFSTLAAATVSARLRKLPLLLSDSTKLSDALTKELDRRGATKIIVVGSTTLVSTKVTKALVAKGYSVSRITSDSPAALAVALMPASVVGSSTSAVFANFRGDSKTLLQAVAYASATNRPLLHVSTSVPTATSAHLKKLGITDGVAIGNSDQISNAAIAKLPSTTRTDPTKWAESSLALARSVPAGLADLVLRADSTPVTSNDFTVHSLKRVLLTMSKGTLSQNQKDWLDARGDISKVVTVASREALADNQLAKVGYQLAQRGPATEIPLLQPVALSDPKAPATFSFSGSGWGHGIGMSQWGAYAMAQANHTSTQILEHYYPGATVQAMKDDADIYVSLLNRVATVKVRIKAVGTKAGSWKLIADDGTSVTLKPAHIASFTFNSSKTLIKTEITGSTAVDFAPTPTIRVQWSGTRFSGDLGDVESVLQVSGPGETFSSEFNRSYRFGMMRLKAAAATNDYSAGIQVTNRLRMHDEYMYGIAEVPSSWPMAALEAQVVTARSYVYYDVYTASGGLKDRKVACDCHVYDDPRDQNFTGYAKLAEGSVGQRWRDAVDSTLVDDATGKVVKYGSTVVQTFFSAASGGATQNNEDVWGGTPRPYFRSVPDEWSLIPDAAVRHSAWEPRNRVQSVLAAAFGLDDVATLDFSSRYVSGSVKTVVATSTTGVKASLSGEKFRLAAKSSDASAQALPSTWIWRSEVKPSIGTLSAYAEDFMDQRSIEFSLLPSATAKQAVLVADPGSPDSPLLAVAAAYAGASKSALVVVRASGDGVRVRDLLKAQGVTSVKIVGAIDDAVVSKLMEVNISFTKILGSTASDMSKKLAQDLNLVSTKGAIVVSDTEASAWPLAVSMSARTGRPLLFMRNGAFSPDLASWLGSNKPANMIAVGTVEELPDVAFAGMTEVSRLNTIDLFKASRIAWTLSTATVRAVTLTNLAVTNNRGVIAAASGSPLTYLNAANLSNYTTWLQRQSLAALVINIGADAELVTKVRRA